MRKYFDVPKPDKRLEDVKITPIVYLQSEMELIEDGGQIFIVYPFFKHRVEEIIISEIAAIIAIEPFNIEPAVLSKLLNHKVPVSLFSSSGQILGRIEPTKDFNRETLKNQITLPLEARIFLQKRLVWGVIRKYRGIIARKVRLRKPENRDTLKLFAELDDLINSIDKKDSQESLSGVLGIATRIYNQSIFDYCIFYDFEKEMFDLMRKTIYSFASQIIESAIASAGLDPVEGFWHKTYRDQMGLVVDVLTQYRPYLDAVVIRLINTCQITLKDFDQWEKENPTLSPKVVSKLIKGFQELMTRRFKYPHLNLECSYEESIHIQVMQIKMYIEKRIDTFYCFEIK